MVQTNGLAGHQHDFYALVSQSDWIGGNSFYSNLEEGELWLGIHITVLMDPNQQPEATGLCVSTQFYLNGIRFSNSDTECYGAKWRPGQ